MKVYRFIPSSTEKSIVKMVKNLEIVDQKAILKIVLLKRIVYILYCKDNQGNGDRHITAEPKCNEREIKKVMSIEKVSYFKANAITRKTFYEKKKNEKHKIKSLYGNNTSIKSRCKCKKTLDLIAKIFYNT